MRWCAVGLFVFAVAFGLRGADDDPIKAKLEKAKATYRADLEKAKQALKDWYEKQGESARKAGKSVST